MPINLFSFFEVYWFVSLFTGPPSWKEEKSSRNGQLHFSEFSWLSDIIIKWYFRNCRRFWGRNVLLSFAVFAKLNLNNYNSLSFTIFCHVQKLEGKSCIQSMRIFFTLAGQLHKKLDNCALFDFYFFRYQNLATLSLNTSEIVAYLKSGEKLVSWEKKTKKSTFGRKNKALHFRKKISNKLQAGNYLFTNQLVWLILIEVFRNEVFMPGVEEQNFDKILELQNLNFYIIVAQNRETN